MESKPNLQNDLSTFGFDLMLRTVEKDIKTKVDTLVVIVHWYLVKCGFRCIGTGESFELNENEDKPSELLPSEWNASPKYTLRYVLNNELFNFMVVTSAGNVIVHLIQAKGPVKCVDIAESEIKATTGLLEEILPNYKDFLVKLQEQFIDSYINPGKKASTSSQTAPLEDRPGPGRLYEPFHNPYRPSYRNPSPDPLRDRLRDIGRRDLDPLHGESGGGMLFNPFPDEFRAEPSMPPGWPRDARPPNARFDPIGPNLGQPRGRNPPGDHFPMPGFDNFYS